MYRLSFYYIAYDHLCRDVNLVDLKLNRFYILTDNSGETNVDKINIFVST